MTNILEVRHVSKKFGNFVANSDVSMEVEAGEIRGLIGPNGAGKTTLCNIITGVYPPSEGVISIKGRSIERLPMHRIARSGVLRTFQICKNFGNMTVRENLLLSYAALHGSGGGEGRRRADHFLKMTNLDRVAGLQAKGLSGGQRALLQVCCGFMDPNLQVYVLDEPFAGINPLAKDKIIELILHENRERNLSFLIVSHEMEVLKRLCRKVTVMIDGKIAAEGPLEEIGRRQDVVKAYLGKALA